MIQARWSGPISSCLTRSFRSSLRSSSYRAPVYSLKGRTASRALTTTPDQASEKPYYVTTPIFYVNASPHVGHLYTILLADVLKRWQILQGDEKAWLLTGTDEHGMKIQNAAAKAKTDTKLFCDENHVQFKHLAEVAEVSYDKFIRTTDDDHHNAVQHFWNELDQRGLIYKSKHEGWYSVSDETFFPQSAVHLIRDPRSGRKLMASMETGREVEWTSEENYHFRLTEFKDRLLDYYKTNPDFIIPKFRIAEIEELVNNNFKDLSISRPSHRLQWGIPVPNDPSQTIYVWVDALINYLTAAGYPFTPGAKSRGWPPNVQVIGKDIIRFHCIYWPALLMALDLPIPQKFLTHAHWTINDAKMSKSDGNAVNPFFAIERFDLDTIRYYMIHDGGINDDAAYDNSHIAEKYKKGLQGGLGNLCSRIIRGKRWSVLGSVCSAERNASLNLKPLEELAKKDSNDDHLHFRDHLIALPDAVAQHMAQPNPRLALHTIMEAVYTSNRYMQARSPWLLTRVVSTTNFQKRRSIPPNPEAVEHIIYLLSEALRLTGIMLQPFIPTHAARLLDLMGVRRDRRGWDYARFAADYEYGTPLDGLEPGKGVVGTVFPPLAAED